MINFFRKKRKKFADDNKAIKYARYAIGEIFLVVIGILIALSINNWNEQRKMNIQEQELLEGLLIEFTINFNRLEKVNQLHLKSIESANELMTYFNQDIKNIPNSKFDSLQFHMENTWTFDPRKGLLNSAIASGKINLITNNELKNQLASFEDMVNDIDEEVQEIRLLGAELNKILYEYINMGIQNGIGYESYVNNGFQSDYNRFFKDMRVYNIINNETTWSYDLLEEETEIMLSINRILTLINQELNND